MTRGATKTLKAIDIGRYFIYRSNQLGKPITNKKLQKLVYYSQAWSLVLNDKKLFNEKIEAWVHGPAIRSLYGVYKDFGFNPIQENVELSSLKLTPKVKKLLNEIWRVYGNRDARYLELLTHSESPWREAREGLQSSENSENEITNKSMKTYYSQLLKEAKK